MKASCDGLRADCEGGQSCNALRILPPLSNEKLKVPRAHIAQYVHQADPGEQGLPLGLAVHKVMQKVWVADHEADRVYQCLHTIAKMSCHQHGTRCSHVANEPCKQVTSTSLMILALMWP